MPPSVRTKKVNKYMISSYYTKLVLFKSLKIPQETSSSTGKGRHNFCETAEYYRQHLSPSGVWLKKTIMLNCQESLHQALSRMQWAYIPRILVATITQWFSIPLGLQCPCPILSVFKLFIYRNLLLLSQTHTIELRVQFIWQGYSSNSHHPWAGDQLNTLYTTQDCCLAAGIKTS